MIQPSAENTELVHRARQGDAEALDSLLSAYRNYLIMLARIWLHRTIPPVVDDSDVVQDTLLKAHKGFAQFRGVSEPELAAWLRRILARSIADAARHYGTAVRHGVRSASLERMLTDYGRGVDELLSASGTSPSQAARRREAGVVLAEALAKLSADYREVIELRSLQEHDWTEVGRRMRRSPDAARMLWTRALMKLRPRIQALL